MRFSRPIQIAANLRQVGFNYRYMYVQGIKIPITYSQANELADAFSNGRLEGSLELYESSLSVYIEKNRFNVLIELT